MIGFCTNASRDVEVQQEQVLIDIDEAVQEAGWHVGFVRVSVIH